MTLAIVRQRLEADGWTVEAFVSDETGQYFEIRANKPGERRVVRVRLSPEPITEDAADAIGNGAAIELARQCSIDVSDL